MDLASEDSVWMVSYGCASCSINDLRLPAFFPAVRWPEDDEK
jgi:hypothetical protein